MPVLPTPAQPEQPTTAGAQQGASPALRAMAVSLWVVVGSLLGYGVLQTVLEAAALFG